jgi:hypothetical protein
MNWANDVARVFGGAKLLSPPDYTVRCVSSEGRRPVFGVVQFVLPAPKTKLNLHAETCCQCDAMATHRRGVEDHKNLGTVPTCAVHSQGTLRLVASLQTWNTHCAQLTVLAESATFLEEIVDLLHRTNIVRPPWVTFPATNPFIGWNTAIEGSWIREVWAPYWRSLSIEQRAEAISTSPPPETWRGWQESVSWEFMRVDLK